MGCFLKGFSLALRRCCRRAGLFMLFHYNWMHSWPFYGLHSTSNCLEKRIKIEVEISQSLKKITHRPSSLLKEVAGLLMELSVNFDGTGKKIIVAGALEADEAGLGPQKWFIIICFLDMLMMMQILWYPQVGNLAWPTFFCTKEERIGFSLFLKVPNPPPLALLAYQISSRALA